MQSKYDELFTNFSSIKQTDDKLKLKLEKQDKIINDFERKFNAKNIEIEKLELERASLQDKLLQLQKFEVKSKLDFHEISAQLHDQQEQQYVTEQANNKLSKDLRLQKTEIQKLNQKLESKNANIDKLESKNAKLIAEIDNLKNELNLSKSFIDIEKQRLQKADNLSKSDPHDVYYHMQEIQRVKLGAVSDIDEEEMTNVPEELQEAFKELRRVYKLKAASIIVAYEALVEAMQSNDMNMSHYDDAMKDLTFSNSADLVMLEDEYLRAEKALAKKFEKKINIAKSS